MKDSCRSLTMCLNLLLLLLLFCLIKYSGTSPASVTGRKGGNVTLSCESQDREISAVDLSSLSEKILVCEKEECKSKNSRVFKEGSCDIIIKNLRFSDAGKYILRVRYSNNQTEEERREYHLHIYDEIFVKKGKDLKLDVLLINADKVEHQKRRSSDWTELWTRGHGVNSDRLTDRDGRLTIKKFTDTDTGTYTVLDSEGEIWITVTVTGSASGSKRKLDIVDNDEPSEQRKAWIIVLSVCGVLLVLAGIISAVYKKCHRQRRNTDHDPVPRQDIEQ